MQRSSKSAILLHCITPRKRLPGSQQLLAVDPACYEAHLASGVSRYIIGSMAAPVRWVLRLGGVSGDKAGGIAELQVTVAKGDRLARFARILLAIAYVREKDLSRARELLGCNRNSLTTHFSAVSWPGWMKPLAAKCLECKSVHQKFTAL